MRTRAESQRLQKLAAELKAEYPKAGRHEIIAVAQARGESYFDACYIVICICAG